MSQCRTHDVVFSYSFESLTDAAIRHFMRPPDRLVSALAGDPAVSGLLVAEPYRSAAAVLLPHRANRPQPVVPGARLNRWSISPRRLLPRELPLPPVVRRSYRSYGRTLGTAALRLGMRDVVHITCHPLVAAFADHQWARRTVYYARDDWTAHPSYASMQSSLLQAYDQMRSSGTPVMAVSRMLLDRIGPSGPSLIVPNGVDEEGWLGPSEPPAWMRGLPHPRAVYVGSIDERLDVEAVGGLLDELTEGCLIMLGPIMQARLLDGLAGHPRLVLAGNVSHSTAMDVMRASDVGLVLHKSSRLTQAMDPLKLVEYLAAGLPVVATDLGTTPYSSPRVLPVQEGRNPTGTVQRALELGLDDEASRRKFVVQNSWASRYRDIRQFAFVGIG